jgi:hypothetical protein
VSDRTSKPVNRFWGTGAIACSSAIQVRKVLFSEFLVDVKQVLTLVVKLQLSAEQQQLIAGTAESFASACNTINQTVNSKLTNRNSIQAVL